MVDLQVEASLVDWKSKFRTERNNWQSACNGKIGPLQLDISTSRPPHHLLMMMGLMLLLSLEEEEALQHCDCMMEHLQQQPAPAAVEDCGPVAVTPFTSTWLAWSRRQTWNTNWWKKKLKNSRNRSSCLQKKQAKVTNDMTWWNTNTCQKCIPKF